MDSGKYALASQTYNSVINIARSETELEQESILSEKLEQLSWYFEISDLLLLGEMNEISGYFAHARQSYDDNQRSGQTIPLILRNVQSYYHIYETPKL
jgi:hypothetical protein